jgi:uncharacterized membrane protein
VSGALFIGMVAALLLLLPIESGLVAAALPALVCALVGGTAGSFADSLLGATVQASYYCPACAKPTESRVHRCGTGSMLVRGVAWMNNDVVNLAATAIGAAVGGVVATAF